MDSSPIRGPFQSYILNGCLAGLPSGAPHTAAKRDWSYSWATLGCPGPKSVCLLPDAWEYVTPLPGPLVPRAGDRTKVKWGYSQVLRVQSCFWVCSQDHSQWISCLGASLISENSSPESQTVLGFHSVLPRFWSPTKALLSMDGCQIVIVEVEDMSGDLIWPFCCQHLPFFFLKYSSKSIDLDESLLSSELLFCTGNFENYLTYFILQPILTQHNPLDSSGESRVQIIKGILTKLSSQWAHWNWRPTQWSFPSSKCIPWINVLRSWSNSTHWVLGMYGKSSYHEVGCIEISETPRHTSQNSKWKTILLLRSVGRRLMSPLKT